MRVFLIQRQPLEADLFDDASWRTVATVTDRGAADRLLEFMDATWPEYRWQWAEESA